MAQPTQEPSKPLSYSQRLLQRLPEFTKGCLSDHPATQFECTRGIRNMLSMETDCHDRDIKPRIQAVIDSGIVPRLVQFLTFSKFDRLAFASAWCLTNIAMEDVPFLIKHGAVPPLVVCLESESIEVKTQALWALTNISVLFQCERPPLVRKTPPCFHVMRRGGLLHFSMDFVMPYAHYWCCCWSNLELRSIKQCSIACTNQSLTIKK
eukprot:636473_1